MADKRRILFVVAEFWQAGTQRFTYELHRVMSPHYSIDIMSYHSLAVDSTRKDYYYDKHKEIGGEVLFLNDLQLQKKKWDRFSKKSDYLNNFFDNYDVISFLGEYTYVPFHYKLSSLNRKKSVIHIMNSKYQNSAIYNGFNKSSKYNFCSGFTKDEVKEELSEFINFNHYFFPLSIKVSNTEPKWSFPDRKTKKIGIFTRITKTKPLDPFLYGFHLLKDYVSDIELHVFGQPDEEIDRVKHIVKYLGIEPQVFFRGHTENMNETALNEELNLVWFHSFYGVPGGFAGFDMASLGIPQLFWNFTQSKNDKMNKAFPIFNKLTSFVLESKEILSNKDKAIEVSNNQFFTLEKTRNIENHKQLIIDMYGDIIKKTYVE